MSPEEIREALAWFENTETEHRSDDHPVAVAMEAARAYADLLENGQEQQWCAWHESAVHEPPVCDATRLESIDEPDHACLVGRYLVVRVEGES